MTSPSKIALYVAIISILYTGFIFYPRWEKTTGEATLSWDVSGYYMYLPAIFIYKDLKGVSFKDSILAKYKPTSDFQQAVALPEGGYVMKYASGQGLLMSPAFAIGHLWAKNSDDYQADGFSYPYQKSVGIWMLLISILGLIIYRKVLLIFFSEKVTAITLISLAIGSNYLNYAAIDQGMTHASLFTVYAIIILFTIKFYNKTSNFNALMVGLFCGLATLIRPTEIISLMIPFAWGINSLNGLKERINYFIKNYHQLIIAAVGFIAFASLQLIYWKYATGQWLFYSYDEQGFSFLHPHLLGYIFSYRCGWLVYCPIMVIPFLALFVLHKNKCNIWPVIVSFMLINLYIVASWDIWWYGGRAMVQSYAIMFLPFAAFTEYVLSKKMLKYFFYLIISIFAYVNIWVIYNFHGGTVNLSEPTKDYFWKVVGRWDVSRDKEKYLDSNEWYEKELLNPVEIYSNNFDTDSGSNIKSDSLNGKYLYLDHDLKYSQEYETPLPPENTDRIRITADVGVNFTEYNSWDMAKIVLRFYENNQKNTPIQANIDRQLYNRNEGKIYLDARLDNKKFNKITYLFFSDNGQKKIKIDNVKIVAFKSM